jgi:hypothetical protein
VVNQLILFAAALTATASHVTDGQQAPKQI